MRWWGIEQSNECVFPFLSLQGGLSMPLHIFHWLWPLSYRDIVVLSSLPKNVIYQGLASFGVPICQGLLPCSLWGPLHFTDNNQNNKFLKQLLWQNIVSKILADSDFATWRKVLYFLKLWGKLNCYVLLYENRDWSLLVIALLFFISLMVEYRGIHVNLYFIFGFFRISPQIWCAFPMYDSGHYILVYIDFK